MYLLSSINNFVIKEPTMLKKYSTLHPDLVIAQELAYIPSGFTHKNLTHELENQGYRFEMNGHIIKFRVANITPTKIGQFVTFWKRSESGPIIPYDIADQFDFLVVSVRIADRLGQFIFPKEVLCKKGFISKDGKGGKRAMRVYPPLDSTHNKQASQTQGWQVLYFFEIRHDQKINIPYMQNLFQCK
jgi:hypothetical protein